MNLLGIDFEDWYHPTLIQKFVQDEKHEPSMFKGLDKILEMLRKNDALATFFVVGELLESNPEIFDKIMENEHEIAFHTMYHTKIDSPNFKENFRNEIEKFSELTNKKSRGLGLTRLATGHNLDDECQSIMMNQFKNNIQASARLGPKVGVKENKSFVQRIKPLYLCTEKEVTTYAFINNLLDEFSECPNVAKSYRAQVRDMLNDFEQKFSGTKYSIVNSFLHTLPNLKQRFKDEAVNYCTNCGEAASKDKCNACKFVDKLNKARDNALIKIKQ